MKIVRFNIFCVGVFLFYISQNLQAALPVEECPTFLAEELTILCFQQSIVEELNHRPERLPYGTIDINLSPNGTINYAYIDQGNDYCDALTQISANLPCYHSASITSHDPHFCVIKWYGKGSQ